MEEVNFVYLFLYMEYHNEEHEILNSLDEAFNAWTKGSTYANVYSQYTVCVCNFVKYLICLKSQSTSVSPLFEVDAA